MSDLTERAKREEPTMVPLSESDLLQGYRAEVEHRSTQSQRDLDRWLKIAGIAVPALMTAAANGNVTCLAACDELAVYLPTIKNHIGGEKALIGDTAVERARKSIKSIIK